MRAINSLVYAPTTKAGGIKSLYSVCEWLTAIGRTSMALLGEPRLASWFRHGCNLYDNSYLPDVLIYPEAIQLYVPRIKHHICFALGRYSQIQPHADLVVCKSPSILSWVEQHQPQLPTALIRPSIDRSIFEYDGRPKQERICFMTRHHKHPETAQLLRERYGDRLLEIVDLPEAEVAEALKSARVFVWRGAVEEGSPRPPKEALVAGCIVVGLETELHERYMTDFGIRCSSVDEMLDMAGEALTMPLPTEAERAVIRDSKEERNDWITLLRGLIPEAKPGAA